MANEWIQSDGRACYDTATPGFTLSQGGVMTAGQFYFVKITVSGMTQGSLTLYGIEDAPVITEDGEYEYISKASFTDLVIYPGVLGSGTFDGCVDDVEVNIVPVYSIKDLSGNTVFEMTEITGVTADRDYVQYQIDWTDLEEGCYYIEFSDGILTYQSYCFSVKLLHSCSLQLEWTNDQDGFGFNYSGLSFTQSMRVDGKLWKPRFVMTDKNVHYFSDGEGKITNVRVYEDRELVIKEMPDYMHRAISVGLNHDSFYIQDIKTLFPDEEVTPAWRNSSNLAPLTVIVRQDQNDLLNSNC
jgi:hypothetical protein